MTYQTIRKIVPPPGHGVMIRHKTKRSETDLIPLIWIPMFGDSLRLCRLCQMVHPVKTIHLELDDQGRALISVGVLHLMRRAGLAEHGYTVDGSLEKPPPLRLGRKANRRRIDFENRAIRNHGVSSG